MSLLHGQVDSLPLGHQGSPALVLLPGESHGQRSLVGYSPWGPKEWDTTEVTWHAYTCGESGRNVAVSWLCTILPAEMSAWDLRAWAWGPAWGGRKLRWPGWHTSRYGLGTQVPCAHNQMKSDEGWRLSKLKVPLSPAVENFYLRKHFSVLCLLLWATLLNLIYAFSWRKSCVSLWKVSFLRDGSRGGSKQWGKMLGKWKYRLRTSHSNLLCLTWTGKPAYFVLLHRKMRAKRDKWEKVELCISHLPPSLYSHVIKKAYCINLTPKDERKILIEKNFLYLCEICSFLHLYNFFFNERID